MYIFENFIEEEFTGVKWNTDKHKELASNILLSNPAITEKDSLVNCCKIINDIPFDKLETITALEAKNLGLPILIK